MQKLNREEIKKEFQSYAERLREVRKLSAPSMEEVKNADDYSRVLLYNFRKIGELAGENAEMLDRILMPMLQGSEPLDEETAEELDALNGLLLDATHTDVMDGCLAEMIDERLSSTKEELPEEEDNTDTDPEKKVRRLDRAIDMAYEHINRSYRSDDEEEVLRAVRKGSADYREMLTFLDKKRFSGLSPEAKKTVLVAARFGACLYELTDPAEMIRCLNEVREILKDPFYREALSDKEFDEHNFLICEYIAEMAYTDDRPEEIYRAAFDAGCECERLVEQGNTGNMEKHLGEEHIRTLMLIAAGRILDPSLERRLSELIELYEKRDKEDYSRPGTNVNLSSALVIFSMINVLREKKGAEVPEKLLALQRRIPYEMMRYYSLARSGEMVTAFSAHLNNFLDDFREIPGGIRFSELSMRALMAIHPPTYVHSNMVAKLSLCLARHLLAVQPERFVGFPGCSSVEDVKASRDRIQDYVYHAALYHDIGKLTIIDTIAMYGRRLLDAEFLMLKKHPDNGARMAERFESIREYADVIRGHHLWYDGSAGYPTDFKTADSPYKTVIDIVQVADCMDAATDRVGRSYSRGKTVDEFINEVSEGAGTRYAPYVAGILKDPATHDDIMYLLDEGRSRIYRDTYRLLAELLQKGRKE